jgi:putative membrane protein
MSDWLKRQPWIVVFVLVVIYLIGIIGLSLEYSRELFIQAVPFTLLFSLVLLILMHRKFTARFIALAVIIYLAGFFVEVAGVATGLIFGGYSYGPTLGPKIWGTPLMIGVNWLLLVYCIWVIVSRLKWNKVALALLGAVFMVIYDLFLEPVAIWLDMWSWESVRVPVQNYVAWFVISFVFFLITGLLSPRIENKIAPALFIIQLLFFIVLNLIMIFIV